VGGSLSSVGPAVAHRVAGRREGELRREGVRKTQSMQPTDIMHRDAVHVTDPKSGAAGAAPWRRRLLERAGFAHSLAASLANDRRTDIHALLELIDRGCPPELAARIAAPLGFEWEPRH
jgi:hypothetical protein